MRSAVEKGDERTLGRIPLERGARGTLFPLTVEEFGDVLHEFGDVPGVHLCNRLKGQRAILGGWLDCGSQCSRSTS